MKCMTALVAVMALLAACSERPAAHASLSSTPVPNQPSASAVARTYGPPPELIHIKTTAEAILQPQDFAITCTGDTCTVAGTLANVGGHQRTSGKVTVTMVDMVSGRILSGCEDNPTNLKPGDNAAVSCSFDRTAIAGRDPTQIQVRYEIGNIRYALG